MLGARKRMEDNGKGKKEKEGEEKAGEEAGKREVKPSEGEAEAQESTMDIGKYGEFIYGWKEWKEEGSDDEGMWEEGEEPIGRSIYLRVRTLTLRHMEVLQKKEEERTGAEESIYREYKYIGGLARGRRIRYLGVKAWRLYEEYMKTRSEHERLQERWLEDIDTMEHELRVMSRKRRRKGE